MESFGVGVVLGDLVICLGKINDVDLMVVFGKFYFMIVRFVVLLIWIVGVLRFGVWFGRFVMGVCMMGVVGFVIGVVVLLDLIVVESRRLNVLDCFFFVIFLNVNLIYMKCLLVNGCVMVMGIGFFVVFKGLSDDVNMMVVLLGFIVLNCVLVIGFRLMV